MFVAILKYSEQCKDCPHKRLYLERDELEGYKENKVDYYLHCSHEDVCGMWDAKLRTISDEILELGRM